jgi:hypothetical protein
MIMRVRSWVNFEFGVKPLLTVRDEFSTGDFESAAKTALRRACAKYPKAKAESMVVVIENLDNQTSPKVGSKG